jgi:hypothetical protein
MMIRSILGIVVLVRFTGALQQDFSSSPPLLLRRYQDGEQLSYLMKGRNNDSKYEVRLTSVVKRGANGQFVEEYTWSDLAANGAPQPLTAASREFRQSVTLAGGPPFTFPDLARVQPGLIGPITDLLTFYSDLFLATNVGRLRKPGDHFFVPSPMVSSWADGTRVVIGEDSIDFEITLTGVDRSRNVATLLIKHMPPQACRIRIPAEWMRAPVSGTPNNWVQVSQREGRYTGAVGKETFDVTLTISLSTGQIVSAALDNLVQAVARECSDAQLTDCGEPRPTPTVRRIEMSLTGAGR